MPETDYTNEVWKMIPRFDGYYEASTIGRIRRYRGSKWATRTQICRSTYVNDRGYEVVKVCIRRKITSVSVHSVVAATFLGPLPKGMTVNHKNLDKTDNRLLNLEYVPEEENRRHYAERCCQIRWRSVEGPDGIWRPWWCYSDMSCPDA